MPRWTREQHQAWCRRRGPSLVAREVCDAPGDAVAAVDIGDFRERSAKLLLQQRKMGEC